MRYTLLELTQLILSSMDGDEVSAIADTVESVQVTTILKNVFYDMATELDLPEHETLFELVASADNDLPALMTIPSDVTKLNWIKYNRVLAADTKANWHPVKYITLDEMVDYSNGLRDTTSNVSTMSVSMNSETHDFHIRTDQAPEFYTTADDFTLIFNSYSTLDEDNTLQASKTMCHGAVYPIFTISDSFAPDLDPTQFAYFIQKAKVRAFFEMKQLPHQEAAHEARRQLIGLQKKQRRTETQSGLQQTVRYGR